MSRTFSCGELKKAKFILSDNVNIAGNEFENLSKAGGEVEGDIYQIKPGARILKINSKDDFINLLEKKSDGNLKYRQIGKNGETSVLAPISDSDYKEILDNIKETYDGISIDKKVLNELTKEERELLGAEEGVKILNKDVLTNISKGEENTSYREGFKANGTELSKEMKEVASKAYMDGGVISGKIAEFPMYNFSSDPDSGLSFYNDEDISDEVKKFTEASKELKTNNLIIAEGAFNKIKTDKSLIVSNGDCFKTKVLCEEALGRSISHKEYIECLSLYAEGSSKVDTESYDKAYSKLKENVIKGVQINSDGSFDRPILYAEDRELITNVSKESLHMEKMAWNHAISKADDSQKELLSEMAKIKLNSYQQTHLDNKLDDIVTYSIGDMEVKFYSHKTTDLINSATEPQTDSSNNPGVRVTISKAFNSAKDSLNSAKEATRNAASNSIDTAKRGFNKFSQRLASARNKVAKVYQNTKQDVKDVYRDIKNLPNDVKNVYEYAKTGAQNAYSGAKTSAKNTYNSAKTSVTNISNKAKSHVQRGASKAWSNIKHKVGTILINTGTRLENAGGKIKTTGLNI